ncbi:MAG: hypothetical protein ACQESP_09120 [Candidatus Muiribacteriota bacterium]
MHKNFKPIILTYGGIDYTLREAIPSDCPEIMDLYKTLYRGYYTIDFCTNAQKFFEAVEDNSVFWLILEKNNKVFSSVFWKINFDCNIAKVMGAAVKAEIRGYSIMTDVARIGTDFCFYNMEDVDLIYSTTRTNQVAPAKILKKIGYECIGILPNVVKTKQFETHSIMVKYRDSVLENRKKELQILEEIKPFFRLVKDTYSFSDNPEFINLPEKKHLKLREIPFEAIYNPIKANNLFQKRIKEYDFNDRFFLQQPNLVLYNPDLNIEVFIRWIDEEKQANIIWLNYENRNWYNILNSITNFCYNLNIRYFEILIDAWDTKKQKAAIEAKFVPSAYFPAIFHNKNSVIRRDAVVFVRSFEILDFSEIHPEGNAKDFLLQFYKSWEKVYIGNFFKNLEKQEK